MECLVYSVPPELEPLRQEVSAINRDLPDRGACYYCGNVSTCEDHVIPHSLTRREGASRTGYGTQTLPACGQCNGWLSARVFDSLAERFTYLEGRLGREYRKHLAAEAWSAEELEELRGHILAGAQQFNRERAEATRRIAYLTRGRSVTYIAEAQPILPVIYSRNMLDKLTITIESPNYYATARQRGSAIADWQGKTCVFRSVTRAEYVRHRACAKLIDRYQKRQNRAKRTGVAVAG